MVTSFHFHSTQESRELRIQKQVQPTYPCSLGTAGGRLWRDLTAEGGSSLPTHYTSSPGWHHHPISTSLAAGRSFGSLVPGVSEIWLRRLMGCTSMWSLSL